MDAKSTVFPLSKLGEYTVTDQEIGHGKLSVIRKGIHTVTGHVVAMKCISRTTCPQKSRFWKEHCRYTRLLNHPHIIRLYEVIDTPEDRIFVLEYARGDLFSYIVQNGRLSEPLARRYFQQIISAVEYSHRLGIVHRDIRPEVVLLYDDFNVKLTGFDLSKEIRDGDFLRTSCGSPDYASPEIYRGYLYAGPEVDVWSAGVLLYVMLCANYPFGDDDPSLRCQKIISGVYSTPKFVSRDARKLMSAMIVVDPLKRITIPKITEHPFFTQDLPRYLSPLPPKRLSGTSVVSQSSNFEIISGLGPVDESVVDGLVAKLSAVTKEDIMACLRSDDDNVVKVVYMLLRDQRKVGKDLAYLAEQERDAEIAALDPHRALSYESNLEETSVESEDLVSKTNDVELDVTDQYPEVNNFAVIDSSLPEHNSPGDIAKESKGSSGKSSRHNKWQCGIRCQGYPMETILMIYKALRALDMEWLEKTTFDGLGCISTNVMTTDKDGESKIERVQRLDGPGEIDSESTGIFFIETRTRIHDVVVLMNIRLYHVNEANYVIDFHHTKSYKASAQPGAGKYSMALPSPAGDEKDRAVNDAQVVSPYVFMEVAVNLMLELVAAA